jgi:hypothetical protein
LNFVYANSEGNLGLEGIMHETQGEMPPICNKNEVMEVMAA